ncbi:hypothetical protein F4804DRAFT_227613 [Jackrogersella minutella]|nr:hypothetical protein F4804DRAFT_227613 [Jackrogersella minutella]
MTVPDNVIPLLAVVTPLLALAFLAVGLRLHVRVALLKNPGADDWLCLAALSFAQCCNLGTYLANMAGVAVGFGGPLSSLSPENRTRTLKTIWISPPLWGLSASLIKMSIVASYLRIWSDRRFRIFCHALLAMLFLFGLTLFLGGVFACVPISLSWTPPSTDSRSPQRCLDLPLFMFATSILNTAADLLIFAIPVPLVRRLQVARRQKAALTGVFTVGAVVCVASVMRLVSIYELDPTTDPSEGGVRLGLWSGIETNLAITCACLPTLRPVLVRLFPRLLSVTPHSSPSWGLGTGTRRWTGRAARDENGTYRMRELPSDDLSHGDGKPVLGDVEVGTMRVSSKVRLGVENIQVPSPSHVDRHSKSYMDID